MESHPYNSMPSPIVQKQVYITYKERGRDFWGIRKFYLGRKRDRLPNRTKSLARESHFTMVRSVYAMQKIRVHTQWGDGARMHRFGLRGQTNLNYI
jgi:hypothetical protein